MSITAARRLGGYALGVLVFLAALGVWELWAGAANSFLVPTASEVAERAWDVWPTSDFLSEVGQSMKRYVVGFAIAAAIGIALGLLVGASRRQAHARSLPRVPTSRARDCDRASRIFILGVGDASRIVVIAFGLCFPILVNTAEGVRGIPLEVRDTASMLHVGRVERLARIYLPAALPSIMAGLRIAVSLGLVLVIVSSSWARRTASATTSTSSSWTTPRSTRASSSSACSGTCSTGSSWLQSAACSHGTTEQPVSEPVLRVVGLEKRYSEEGSAALAGVTFDVVQGEL